MGEMLCAGQMMKVWLRVAVSLVLPGYTMYPIWVSLELNVPGAIFSPLWSEVALGSGAQ